MKKIIACLLILVLALSSLVYADGSNSIEKNLKGYEKGYSSDALFNTTSNLYIDGVLVSSENKEVKGEYYFKVIESGKRMQAQEQDEFIIYGTVYYQIFACENIMQDYKQLWVGPLSVGSDNIINCVTWNETWLVDQFGNKLSLESKTAPGIDSAYVEYNSIPGFTIWSTFTFNSSRSLSTGKIDSIYGGTTSYIHEFLARYN